MTEYRDYDALVQDINLHDITSTEHNANILRRLRDGDPEWNKTLHIIEEEIDGDIDEFIVRMGDNWGWLVYFIGMSEVLQQLSIWYLPGETEQIDAFMRGITHNQSIQELIIHTDIGDHGFEHLGSFLRNNSSLTRLKLEGFDVGRECAHNIAMALERCRRDSLKCFDFTENNISDAGFAEIATALSTQSQLERLQLSRNNIGRNGSVALGNTIGRWPSPSLKVLNLSANSINDQGLQALVEGITNCVDLEALLLSQNRSITSAGLRCMSPLFQSESCSLRNLSLYDINIGDDGAIALTDGLKGNKSLKRLSFVPTLAGVTDVGWAAFSNLLCDTSSINNTYLSNHTLEFIGDYFHESDTPPQIKQYLGWNRDRNRTPHRAAFRKILKSHTDFDMEPFFQWKLKCLPVIVNWFERAIHFLEQEEIDELSLESRKLSSVYNFVRGMPMLVIDSYQSKQMTHSRKRKRGDEDGQPAVGMYRV